MTKSIYAAYREVPKQYYIKDGVYKEYTKFFESELDCARYCVENTFKYDIIDVEPDSTESSASQTYPPFAYREL